MVQLSKRLQAVANLVIRVSKEENVNCVADIGTDHGYIPIYLIEQEICRKAIAMDIGKGPLQRAREHIEKQELGAYIETRLSNGLAELKKDEAQVIVVAGMGGKTMEQILEQGKAVLDFQTFLVLQPQSEIKEFRQYLWEHDFEILWEDMIFEEGKYYPMILAKKGHKSEKKRLYQDVEFCYGPILLQQRHPILKEYLLWQFEGKNKILQQLEQNASTEVKDVRRKELEAEVDGIEQALQMYEDV